MTIKEQKDQLRQLMREKIKHFHGEHESRHLCTKLQHHDIWTDAEHILLYAPMRGEVDLLSLFEDSSKCFYFPRVEGVGLRVFRVESLEDLEKGAFGILEPKLSCEEVEGFELDLIVLPGLAFDVQGNRLGKGRGYYDRFLEKISERKKVSTLALAFSFQVVEEVPVEVHDEKIDVVIF